MAGGPRLFVSHAGADRAWAEWVAWQLENAGWTVELDCWDWAAGDNFVLRMDAALTRGRMVALFSAAYFDPERFTTLEWTALLAAREKMVPVRIDGAAVPPVLGTLIAPSLVGLEATEARRVVLEAVAGPRRPDGEPVFPGPNGDRRARGNGAVGPRLPGSLPRVWNLPRRNAGFTGRDGLLVALREALSADTRVAVQALRGRGGVGKTQLAIEYGHRFAGEYELAWWVRAEEPALIGDQLAVLAVKAGVAEPDTSVAEAVEALWERLRTQGRWLLVFDNAEDPAALDAYLPDGAGHVVITSRNPDWQDRAVRMEVDTFARAESVALLWTRVPGLTEEDADELADLLEDLPLALAQAAALLADGLTVRQYRRLWETSVGEVLDQGRPAHYPVSLAAQIRLSTQKLAEANPAAVVLLRACALLAPEPFPLHACEDGVADVEDAPAELAELLGNPLKARQALRALAQHALARVQEGMVQLHRLTQTVVRAQLDEVEHAEAARSAEALLAAGFPGDPSDPENWPHWPDMLPHLLAVEPSELLTDDGRMAAGNACWYLLDRGGAAVAMQRLEELQQAWTDLLGSDHEDTLAATVALARALAGVGQPARARELGEEVLERQRRLLGVDHPLTLLTASNLAIDLANLGELEAARALGEDTLARQRRVLGVDHPGTLRTATGLGSRLAASGELEAARALGEDTLARQRRVLGEEHLHTLGSASNLVIRLAALGEMEAARVLAEDVVRRQRRVLGDDHPDTLRTAELLRRLVDEDD